MVLGHASGAAGALLASTSGQARRLAALGAIAGAGAGLALGLDTLIWGTPLRVELPWLLELAGGVSLQLDRLGALFLVIVEVVAVPAALYGAAYSRVYEGTSSSLRLLGAMSNLFLLAMALVPLADNIVTFLFCWELMSVTSYFLVLTESDRRDTRQAGLWYLAMAHGGLVLALAAFLLLGGGGGVHRLRGPPRRRARAPRVHAERGVPPGASRIRLESGAGPAPRVAAARASGRAEPRIGAHVRRDDEAGHLRAASDRPGSARRRARLVGRRRPGGGRRVRAARRPVRPDGAGPEAAPRLLHRRERRHHLPRRRRGTPVPQLRPSRARAPRAGGRPLSRPQPRLLQGPALPRCGGGAARHAHAEHGGAGRAHQGHAPDGSRLPAGRRRHLGPAAAQWLRLRVARLPGPPRRSRGCRARSWRSSCRWRWGCSR